MSYIKQQILKKSRRKRNYAKRVLQKWLSPRVLKFKLNGNVMSKREMSAFLNIIFS